MKTNSYAFLLQIEPHISVHVLHKNILVHIHRNVDQKNISHLALPDLKICSLFTSSIH